MPHADEIEYALSQTVVLHEPDRRIDTFGETRFEFWHVSEVMDAVGVVKIREGWLEAQAPRILRPEAYQEVELEGFGEDAQGKMREFLEFLKRKGKDLAFLQYGFQFRRTEVREEIVHEGIESVREKLLERQRVDGAPSRAIVEGVDDVWEVSIFRLAVELILKSRAIHAFDLKRKGLL